MRVVAKIEEKLGIKKENKKNDEIKKSLPVSSVYGNSDAYYNVAVNILYKGT